MATNDYTIKMMEKVDKCLSDIEKSLKDIREARRSFRLHIGQQKRQVNTKNGKVRNFGKK